ncbi:MAG: hypothetical protein HKO73_12580 [Woeseiaceae bacterium]|nr:hypothetical protein [Woeseiaceae bacterium]
MPSSTTLNEAESLATIWSKGEIDVADIPIQDWSPQATVHFINSLPADVAGDRLKALDDGLNLSDTRNAEIGRAWFIQVAERRYTPAYEALESYLNRYGRGRLIFPIYLALAGNGADQELALKMFERARTAYHPLAESRIARALEPDEVD